MSLSIRLLGTSASRPTVERNVSAVAIHREGETLLVDCGEGTQRQMMRYGISFALEDIFFTHMHADHILGVIGLIRTMALQGRTEKLRLWGTTGRACWRTRRSASSAAFPVDILEISRISALAERLRDRRFSVDPPRLAVARLRARDRDAKGGSIRTSRASLGFPKARCGARSIAASP